jgi:putative ABC transport system permease protein
MLADVRQALRALLTSPGFSALVVLILAVGIGATSTIFSIVNAVLLRPLPFPEPSRLVDITNVLPNDEEDSVSYPDLKDWQAQATTFSGLAGYFASPLTLSGRGPARSIQVSGTTSEMFPVLGVTPILGRTLIADDDRKRADVVVISEGLWERVFARQASVIGEHLVLDGRSLTIVGVLPAAFDFPIQADRIEAWVPLTAVDLSARFVDQRGAHFLRVIGRLSPAAAVVQADSEIAAIAKRLMGAYPQANAGRSARVYLLQARVVADYQLALLVLIAAVGAVLLIACGNVANLLLVRGTTRQREMAIRSAMGAPRTRLIRQLLVESLMFSTLAGGAGVLIAVWALPVLSASLPFELPRVRDARIDGIVLLFLTTLSVMTAVLFGTVPAVQVSAASATDALKDAAHGTTAGRSTRMRQVLVVAEVALSLVLLASAGLLIRSLVSLQHVDPGFVADHAIGGGTALPESQYPDDASRIAFARRALDAARQVPGVTVAAVSTTLPLTGNVLDIGFDIEGQPRPPGVQPTATYYAISPDYFRAMGIRLVGGRPFDEHDNEQGRTVLIVSETMARRYWPNGHALGKRVTIGYNNSGPREIVGIVSDVKNGSLSDAPAASMYTPFPQTPWPMLGIVVRTSVEPSAMVASLSAALSRLNPDMPVDDMQVLSNVVARTTATPRFLTTSVAVFAGFALLLAGCGLFSVLAYSVAQRRREIGIRMALGAGTADVARDVLGQAFRLSVIGLGIGLAGAVLVGRLLQELLFKVGPADAVTLAAVAMTLGAIVLLASYVPAKRAIRVAPADVLRAD